MKKSIRKTPLLIIMFLIGIISIPSVTYGNSDPAFPSPASWFNVSRPLTVKDLKGRVVLLDFFTPGCINCIHTLPSIRRLEEEYSNQLLVIGVNSPKFNASQRDGTITGFIRRYDISHPVITDKHMVLWRQYGVYAWPTFILLGANGQLVGRYIGEGNFKNIRRGIIKALMTARHKNYVKINSILPISPLVIPNTPLLQPGKIAVNTNYVAVSDTGHNRIVILNHRGNVIRVVGNGQRGHINGNPHQASFNEPEGLAFDGNKLFIADTGNHLIREISLKDFTVTTVAGNGRQKYGVYGSHNAKSVSLNSPWGLTRIGHDLYIAMAGDHQVWKLNLINHRIEPFAGDGTEGIKDGQAKHANFAQSSGLAFHDGDLYVADPESSSIRVIEIKNGYVRTLIGHGLFVFGFRNGHASQALLQHDQGVTFLNGVLYIADTFNNAIRALNLTTKKVSTLADGLAQPGGLAVLNNTHLIVADTNNNKLVTVNIVNGKVRAWPVYGLNPPK